MTIARDAAPAASPPRPPLAFRVGITGHRLERLGDGRHTLGAALEGLLQQIRQEVESVRARAPQAYADTPTQWVALSSMADGSDRIFADVALRSGWALSAVLPFPRPEAEADDLPPRAALPDSLQEHNRLLDHEHTQWLALDGHPERREPAYAAAGAVVANECDLLIVVWDGAHRSSRYGTEHTASLARRRGVPVLWVQADTPHACQVLAGHSRLPMPTPGQRALPRPEGHRQALADCIAGLLDPPRADPHQPTQTSLDAFHAETRPRWNRGRLWMPFRNAVARGQLKLPVWRVAPFEASTEALWRSDHPAAPAAAINQRLRTAYLWADGLAVAAANRYRSGFLWCYLLAAFAVGFALLPSASKMETHGAGELACTVAEGVTIFIVLAIVTLASRERLHAKAIDYRTLAELLRHLRLVAPLAGQRPVPAVSAHLATYDDPQRNWMAWTAHAWARGLRLPQGTMDAGFLRAALQDLRETLTHQLKYHKQNAKDCEHLEHRLHGVGKLMFGLTLLCCAVHLLAAIWEDFGHHVANQWLTFGAAFMPALGASLAGIVNHGEFRRIGKRSRAMAAKLADLQREADKLLQSTEEPGTDSAADGSQTLSARAAGLAADAAHVMVTEVLDWRVVLLDRPPELT